MLFFAIALNPGRRTENKAIPYFCKCLFCWSGLHNACNKNIYIYIRFNIKLARVCCSTLLFQLLQGYYFVRHAMSCYIRYFTTSLSQRDLKRARANIKTTASIWLIFHTPWNDAVSWRCWVLNTSYVFRMYSFKSKNPSLFLWTINLNRTHAVSVRFLFGFPIRTVVTSFTAQFKWSVDLLSSLHEIQAQ